MHCMHGEYAPGFDLKSLKYFCSVCYDTSSALYLLAEHLARACSVYLFIIFVDIKVRATNKARLFCN